MPKKIFIISIILGIILTPCSFYFPKPNNLYDLTSSSAVYAAGAEAINDSEIEHICATSTLTMPKRDWRGYLITQTLTADKSPYYFTGTVYLVGDSVLTIEPGVVIKFGGEYFNQWYMYPVIFMVSGKIIAQGTEANPIVFTSIYDDSYCGDSNGDGAATAPEPGSWGGWQISSGNNIFDHVIMKYGGADRRGLMGFHASTGNQITNSVFENNLRGIDFRVASSSNPAVIENNAFFNNTRGVISFHNSA
ncbi:hypothetical protein KJ586_00400, partial [Patescibacteria group bacterium]|nr:hypothetical protein [Patescibacteria group bacterium]